MLLGGHDSKETNVNPRLRVTSEKVLMLLG